MEKLALGPWASQRRAGLLKLLDELQASIEPLDQAVEKEAKQNEAAVRLMSQPGVGPITALAFVLTLGDVNRFQGSKQVVSYLGLNPREHSSGGRQRLGSISKQGNTMMRWLLVEAGQTAARFDPELRRKYLHLKFRRGSSVAKVAIARALAVKLYWTLRNAHEKTQPVRMSGSPSSGVVPTAGSTD